MHVTQAGFQERQNKVLRPPMINYSTAIIKIVKLVKSFTQCEILGKETSLAILAKKVYGFLVMDPPNETFYTSLKCLLSSQSSSQKSKVEPLVLELGLCLLYCHNSITTNYNFSILGQLSEFYDVDKREDEFQAVFPR